MTEVFESAIQNAAQIQTNALEEWGFSVVQFVQAEYKLQGHRSLEEIFGKLKKKL